MVSLWCDSQIARILLVTTTKKTAYFNGFTLHAKFWGQPRTSFFHYFTDGSLLYIAMDIHVYKALPNFLIKWFQFILAKTTSLTTCFLIELFLNRRIQSVYQLCINIWKVIYNTFYHYLPSRNMSSVSYFKNSFGKPASHDARQRGAPNDFISPYEY